MNNFRRNANVKMTLGLSSSTYNADENAGSTTFDILVNNIVYTGNATVSSGAPWVTISNNNGTVTINYTENTSGDSRNAIIGVYVKNETVTFTLSQKYVYIVTSLVSDGTVDGHPYITIGNQKWAINNVGAQTDGGYGGYYAWGETTTKNSYTWANYQLCNGSATTLTKYNDVPANGTVDNKIVLESSDDAAYVNMGSNWKTPTREEFQTLLDAVGQNWRYAKYKNGNTTVSYGLLFTSRTDSSKYLYIPYAGSAERWGAKWGNETTPPGNGFLGDFLWTSSLYYYTNGYGSSVSANNLGTSFTDGSPSVHGSQSRYYGFNVRGIVNETPTVVNRQARVYFSNRQIPYVTQAQFGRYHYGAQVEADNKQCDISDSIIPYNMWYAPSNSNWYWDVQGYYDIFLYTDYSDGTTDITEIDRDVLLTVRYKEVRNNFSLMHSDDDGRWDIDVLFRADNTNGLAGYPQLNGIDVSYADMWSDSTIYQPDSQWARLDVGISDNGQHGIGRLYNIQDSMEYCLIVDADDPNNPKLKISKVRPDYLIYNYNS